jgi:hypothetical protein
LPHARRARRLPLKTTVDDKILGNKKKGEKSKNAQEKGTNRSFLEVKRPF